MKKILFSILALFAIATTASAAEYNIWVGGVKVTDSNNKNITGGGIQSGTVLYEPVQKILYLKNVKISRNGGDVLANTGVEGLTIVFEGTNELFSNNNENGAILLEKNTTIMCNSNSKTNIIAESHISTHMVKRAIYKPKASLTITGKGKLYISSYGNGIEGKSYQNSSDVMTIEDTQVEIEASDPALVDFSNITIEGNAKLTLTPWRNLVTITSPRLYQVANMTFKGYQHISAPDGAVFSSTAQAIVLNNQPVTNKTIVIDADVIPLDNNSMIPDANFRSYLKTTFANGKNYLTRNEAAKITEIDVRAKNISNLTGIQHFTNLKTLNCTENNLTSLDVSANTELTTLYCSINQLSALDVSKNKKLTTLYCYYNQIGKDAMQTLVNGLPTVSNRQFRAINMDGINNGKEKNFITPTQVEAAKNKGWNVWGKCDVDGTFKWQEFAGAVTITATANNADYGTVTGAGIYEKGRNVTLKATRNRGYKFVKWTANGTQVSTDATYTFTADGDKEYTAVFEKETTNPKTLAVTFTKATTLASELSNEDKLVLAAVVVLAQKGKLDGYSVGIDPRDKGVVTLKKDKKTLFVSDNNKGITVPNGVTSADNINVTLTDDLRKALGTTLAPQLASYAAIQIKFNIGTTGLTAVESGQLTVDSWYTIDGVKLQGEPTKKGVYIYKGKKVVKK